MATAMRRSIFGRLFGLADDNSLLVLGEPYSVTMTAAAGGSNVAEVTCQVVDYTGAPVARVCYFDLFLSDSASGLGLTATSASGAVAAKSASGADIGTLTSKKALRVQTLATGIYVLSITDSSKTAFKVCSIVGGRTNVGITLAAGNYG